MSDELNRQFLSLAVSETDYNRAYWIEKSWASSCDQNSLAKADLLFVPNESFREEDEPYFPKGTANFIGNFEKLLPEHLSYKVAIDNDKYQEIALHADVWRIPTLVFSLIVLPIILNIFSNRLDEVLPGHKIEDTIEMNIIIEGSNKKAIRIQFRGPTTEVVKLLSESVPSYVRALEQTPRINKTFPNAKRKYENAK